MKRPWSVPGTQSPFVVQSPAGIEVKGKNQCLEASAFDGIIRSLTSKLNSSPDAKISDLDLSQNPLTPEQFRRLFTLIQNNNTKVLRIRLFACVNLNDSAADIISNYLSSCTDETAPWELHLSDCAITSVGFEKLVSAIEGSGLYPLYDANSGKARPLYMRLERNFIGTDSIQEYVDSGAIEPCKSGSSNLREFGSPPILLVEHSPGNFQQRVPGQGAKGGKAVGKGGKGTALALAVKPQGKGSWGSGGAPSTPGGIAKGQWQKPTATAPGLVKPAAVRPTMGFQASCKWCQLGECWTPGHQGAGAAAARPAKGSGKAATASPAKGAGKALAALPGSAPIPKGSVALPRPKAKALPGGLPSGQVAGGALQRAKIAGFVGFTGGQTKPVWKGAALASVPAVVAKGIKRPGTALQAAVAPPAAKKQKVAPDTSNICWEFVRNACSMGASCPFDHAATSAMLSVKANQGSRVKGRTEEQKTAAKEMYASWAEERIVKGGDPDGANAETMDWWYCQVCLICLKEVDWNVYQTHKCSKTHLKQYTAANGFQLRDGVLRPDPDLERPYEQSTVAQFTACAGLSEGKVLTLGEQDYSFSLAVAKHQMASAQYVSCVASSYLAEHDPDEPEVHVRDDGMRAHYSRRSLPSMDGALQKNIDDLTNIGGVVLHSVDATDLPGTLLSQHGDTYNLIVFPFPRASLQRGCQPKNPSLLRNFFRSVNEAGVLEAGGKIGIILLRTQFAEWDTACLALEAGYQLVDHVALPDGFYQGREMSGKIFDSWKKIGAELYMFGAC
eukprot:TRINITY_DN8411_c0_g1_i1.p1 TRINITY_DN8411_c0_g1~~TRINITY_DN8411_c0_g1_i1.p1  ORF type:complete len:787 (+),score=124.37 TRINITY_DN8411_c0_g1_i1:89-2449(+)